MLFAGIIHLMFKLMMPSYSIVVLIVLGKSYDSVAIVKKKVFFMKPIS